MTTTERSGASISGWDSTTVQVCGGEVSLRRAGSGPTLLVLPRDHGHPPESEFLERLAGEFTVHLPWLPGFHGGRPEQWEWLSSVRDVAIVLRQALDALDLGQVGLVGLGFGGWVAAEMATMGPRRFARLVLVNPMGIKPENGFIADQFLISTEAYVRLGYAVEARFESVYGAEPEFEQLEAWETDREMTSRVAWKPYMYDPSLPRLLGGVTTPALVVRGDSDKVVPGECAELYRAAIPGARLEVIADSGHAIDVEQPEALSAVVAPFLRK